MSSSLIQIARSQLAKVPEITAVVVGDRAGGLLDCSGELDGEAASAVYAVAVAAMSSAGELLGMGGLLLVSITGRTTACVLGVHEHGVVAAHLDPNKPSNGVERKIELALRR
jgi:predicted regulator of Ras-like GTPase activity (Roadblock/LC7/MglB family)